MIYLHNCTSASSSYRVGRLSPLSKIDVSFKARIDSMRTTFPLTMQLAHDISSFVCAAERVAERQRASSQ